MKYNVSFVVEGRQIADNIRLNKENIRKTIELDFDLSSISYYGNRDIDTTVTNLKIERSKK